jgi:alkanesulfonate monooxygenase SsuD/methylene tetrahydromethanopterin reductase-like flavin-dependent oxidoreductase (luciferase family)
MGNGNYSVDKLRELSKTLEDNGYSSILLTYKSNVDDRWIQVANIINKNQKLKYTIALRTYAISPEYTATMFNACEAISKNRIQFNIISGDIANNENIEPGVIEIYDLINTPEKRILYTSKWIKSFLNLKTLKSKPYIWMSGKSDKTKEIANEYADLFIGVYSDYEVDPRDQENIYKIKTSSRGFAFGCLIRDTDEEAKKTFNYLIELNNGQHLGQTFYGTENTVKDQILDFCKKYSITDAMVVEYENDKEFYRVHDMVRSIKNGGII